MTTRFARRVHTAVTRRVIGALAALALAGGIAAGPAFAAAAATRPTAAVRAAATAADGFVDSLDPDQRRALADGIPNVPGTGLRLGDLTADQRAAAYALLRSLLSEEAWEQLADLVDADAAIGATDDYWVALFGDPAGDFVLQFSTPDLALSAIRQGDTVDVQPDVVA